MQSCVYAVWDLQKVIPHNWKTKANFQLEVYNIIAAKRNQNAQTFKGRAYVYKFNGEQFAQVIDINGFPFLNSKDTMHINSNYEMEFIGNNSVEYS